jgi:hypothetical protein
VKSVGESIEIIPGKLSSLRIADPPIRVLNWEQFSERGMIGLVIIVEVVVFVEFVIFKLVVVQIIFVQVVFVEIVVFELIVFVKVVILELIVIMPTGNWQVWHRTTQRVQSAVAVIQDRLPVVGLMAVLYKSEGFQCIHRE